MFGWFWSVGFCHWVTGRLQTVLDAAPEGRFLAGGTSLRQGSTQFTYKGLEVSYYVCVLLRYTVPAACVRQLRTNKGALLAIEQTEMSQHIFELTTKFKELECSLEVTRYSTTFEYKFYQLQTCAVMCRSSMDPTSYQNQFCTLHPESSVLILWIHILIFYNQCP